MENDSNSCTEEISDEENINQSEGQMGDEVHQSWGSQMSLEKLSLEEKETENKIKEENAQMKLLHLNSIVGDEAASHSFSLGGEAKSDQNLHFREESAEYFHENESPFIPLCNATNRPNFYNLRPATVEIFYVPIVPGSKGVSKMKVPVVTKSKKVMNNERKMSTEITLKKDINIKKEIPTESSQLQDNQNLEQQVPFIMKPKDNTYFEKKMPTKMASKGNKHEKKVAAEMVPKDNKYLEMEVVVETTSKYNKYLEKKVLAEITSKKDKNVEKKKTNENMSKKQKKAKNKLEDQLCLPDEDFNMPIYSKKQGNKQAFANSHLEDNRIRGVVGHQEIELGEAAPDVEVLYNVNLSKNSKKKKKFHPSEMNNVEVTPNEKILEEFKDKSGTKESEKKKKVYVFRNSKKSLETNEVPKNIKKMTRQYSLYDTDDDFYVDEFQGRKSHENDMPSTSKQQTPDNRSKNKNGKLKLQTPEKDNADDSFQSNKSKKRTPKPKKIKLKLKQGDAFEEYLDSSIIEEGLKAKTMFQGELRINTKNTKRAYMSTDDGNDILINGLANRNRAFEGDVVVVKLLPLQSDVKANKEDVTSDEEAEIKPSFEGKVVAILKQNHKRLGVGQFSGMEGSYAVLTPRDLKLPMVAIPEINMPVGVVPTQDIIYTFQIVSWEHTGYAIGTLIRELGAAGDVHAEKTAIQDHYDIDPLPVPEDLEVHLPPFPYTISSEEIASRKDLRETCIFTIDPATARDLDDALSIDEIEDEDGTWYELGVHISDVSHFLEMGTPLDEFISKRATSVYFVDNVYHMLPQKLCTLCSLLPGQEKLAFSAIFIINEEGDIKSVNFYKSIIKSCAQLSYAHAQAVIDGVECTLPEIYGWTEDCIKQKLELLNKVAKGLRGKRNLNGYLRLNQPKPFFSLDENSLPVTAQEYLIQESNRLVEEFMLLANTHVATVLLDKYPEIALLRKHPPPKESVLKTLREDFEKLGIFLDTSSAGDLQRSINTYFLGNTNLQYILSHYLVKSMKRALYTCSSDTHHYALNVPVYTHFTSPIRRYADVVVHRLLSAYIGVSEVPKWTTETVLEWADNCNRRKLLAQRASEKCNELFAALYINRMGSLECKGIVAQVTPSKLEVLVCELAILIPIKYKKMDLKTHFIHGEVGSFVRISWSQRNVQELSIFSEVQVELKCPSVQEGIKACLLKPPKIIEEAKG